MSTNIPEARRLLEEAKAYSGNPAYNLIDKALDIMTRKVRPARRNPNHVTMTPSIGAEARRLHRTTKMTNAEIGNTLGVDGGRVSEALNGMWT